MLRRYLSAFSFVAAMIAVGGFGSVADTADKEPAVCTGDKKHYSKLSSESDLEIELTPPKISILESHDSSLPKGLVEAVDKTIPVNDINSSPDDAIVLSKEGLNNLEKGKINQLRQALKQGKILVGYEVQQPALKRALSLEDSEARASDDPYLTGLVKLADGSHVIGTDGHATTNGVPPKPKSIEFGPDIREFVQQLKGIAIK